MSTRQGGYDEGYMACPCFWGKKPGSMVTLAERWIDYAGKRVLDVGCGEGKNAAFLATRGASVRAFDVSMHAIKNAVDVWGEQPAIEWQCADVRDLQIDPRSCEVVVAYGVMHCLPSRTAIRDVTSTLRSALTPGGLFVLCAFNDRRDIDARAHPGFSPTLISHAEYVQLFEGSRFLHVTDEDLVEKHPHNNIEHVHSMTRLIIRI